MAEERSSAVVIECLLCRKQILAKEKLAGYSAANQAER